jgi:hypothetical protein
VYISLITSFNSEDRDRTASRTLVSNHPRKPLTLVKFTVYYADTVPSIQIEDFEMPLAPAVALRNTFITNFLFSAPKHSLNCTK